MSERSIATVGVGEDDLVTGEAVALELPAASIGLRVLATLLDYLIVGTAGYMLMILMVFVVVSTDAALGQAVVLLSVVATTVGYPVTMETLTQGRTVGKMAAGLRTVRDDAGPITFRHALTRGLIGFVEVYLFYGIPAVVAAVIHPRSKRLGDMAAGTYVVRDRVRAQLQPPVPMPPHLHAWAMQADIARLPDGLAMQVRTFLPAAFTMTAHVREQMGRELLAEVLLYVSPPPPPGNHPEYVLAAVVADRRRRDLQRLHRDAYLRDRLIRTDPVELAGPAAPWGAPPVGMPHPQPGGAYSPGAPPMAYPPAAYPPAAYPPAAPGAYPPAYPPVAPPYPVGGYPSGPPQQPPHAYQPVDLPPGR